MTLIEKAAYVKGLADGLELDSNTKEGKLISALIDIVGEMTNAMEKMGEDIEDLNDYVEEIDEDLGAVEELVYDCDDDFECDGNCCDCDEDCDADDDYFEVECPSCGETICFDGTIDPEELACPACGEKFECIIPEEDLDDLKAIDAK